MSYTPEPWKVEPDLDICAEHDWDKKATQYVIASTDGSNPAKEANAARIVSCVNGCAGLNPAAYRECVEALQMVVRSFEGTDAPVYLAAQHALTHAQEQP